MADLNFKEIGKKIRERRLTLGMTQESIANQLDVNPSHISNIECGRANPSLTALIKIANILQCSVDYFISGEYTYLTDRQLAKSLEMQIVEKLQDSDVIFKRKILKLIDVLMETS